MRAPSLDALKVWKNKFCPVCRERFGGRLKALQVQAEHGEEITVLIVRTGRAAFDWYSADVGRDVLARFADSLGVSHHTLADWLQFFFGMSWPDWKRRFICSSHSCSIVDTSKVQVGHRPKYYAVDQFRRRGVCACPIKGDDLILVDRRPEDLTSPGVDQHFAKTTTWVRRLKVISGSHLDLLTGQED